MTAAGLHMQWNQCSVGMKSRLESHIKTGNPGAVVFFDSDGKSKGDALRIARMYPNTVVIYRHYIQGDHQYRYLTPIQFINEHIEFRDGPGNLFVQIDNEPNALAGAAWMLAVMKLARSYRIRCAVGGYGVGQPEPVDLQTKAMSDIIRYMAANPGWFVLNLHEYTKGSVFVDWDRGARDVPSWPTSVPPGTTHHLMGRWKMWKARAAELGVASPKIVIGEWGFDYVQAVSDAIYGAIGSILSSLPTWRGWSSLNPEVFAARMLQRIFRLLYDDPDIIGVVIFCISDHPTDWAEWNINYVPLFLNEISKGFERMTTPPQKPPTAPNPHKAGKNRVTLAPGVVYVNSRETPNGIDRGDIKTGDIVDVAPEVMQLAGSFYWFKIKTPDGDRWVAQTASIESLVPVSAVSIPEFIAQQRAILDEMEAAYNRGEL